MGFGGWVCMNCVASLGVVGVGWGTKSGCGGWICVNCVADVGVEKNNLLVLKCIGRDSSLFMEGLEVLWK